MRYPAAFYAAYFSVHAEAFDVDVITAGKEAVKKRITELKAKYPDLEEDRFNLPWERYEALESAEEKLIVLQVALEMFLRGFTVEPVEPDHAGAEQFIILDKYMKPLLAVRGKEHRARR